MDATEGPGVEPLDPKSDAKVEVLKWGTPEIFGKRTMGLQISHNFVRYHR